MTEALKPLPMKEAVDFFRAKGHQTGFSYQDVWKEEHAYSFTVAKAMRNDILQDIRSSVDKAISEGITFEDFRKELEPTLADKGWWGRKMMTDPLTGEEKMVQLGSPRRLRTIYETNLRTAHAAARWERAQRNKKTRPFKRYVAVLDGRSRHTAWHGIVLPVDHPFWDTHDPPNDYGCRCTSRTWDQDDLDREGWKVTADDDLPSGNKTFMNRRTGEITTVPAGIGPGFDYSPGKARMKAMTPPPLEKPLRVPFAGDPAKVPFPASRALGKNVLYPSGLLPKQYVNRFLREFDAAEKSVVFKDAAGEPVIISDDLLKTAGGELKVHRDLRWQHLGLLARTIKDPDEIWHVWEEYPAGRWTLRRKYMAKWTVEGETVPAFVLFDTGRDGWSGVTTFSPGKEAYIDKERRGALVYRRPDAPDKK